MVKAKVILAAGLCLALAGCAGPRPADSVCEHDGMRFEWRRFAADGSRTGVKAVVGDSVKESLGTVCDGVYTAPDGRRHRDDAVCRAASALLDAQETMAPLREIIGHSPRTMSKHHPESELSNWTVDALMKGVEAATGRKVDIGITNFGGIRTDMPEGDVLIDDIASMFPFKNYLCLVELDGRTVLDLFERMAPHMQCVGGVKVTLKDRRLESLEVGGGSVDPDRIYNVATIDFLLDGGDDLHVARGARDLVITEVRVKDWIERYVREITAAGGEIEYQTDGRVVEL